MAASPELRRLAVLAVMFRAGGEPRTFAQLREALPDAWPGGLAAARRKFERDKRGLAELGVQLRWDEGNQSYHLDHQSLVLRPVRFDRAEATAVFHAAALGASDPSGPFAATLASTLARLRAAGEDLAAPKQGGGLVVHQPRRDRAPDLAARIDRGWTAVRRRLRLSFSYVSQSERGTPPRPRMLEAWGLFSRSGHWYTIGRCVEKDRERTFALDRMIDLTVVGLPDNAPTYEVPPDFDLRAAATRPPWMWGDRTSPVTLRAHEGLIVAVARLLGPSARIEVGQAGDLVHAEVRSPVALVEPLFQWLPRVEPLSPPELVLAWRSRMAEVRSTHTGPCTWWPTGPR